MDKAYYNKGLFDTIDNLEQYKFSGKIFSHKYIKQFFVLLLSNITTLLLLTVDGFVVSHFVEEGKDALNSVNLLNPFTYVSGAAVLLFASGANIVLSKAYGVGSGDKTNKLYRAITVLTEAFFIGITLLQIPVSYLMISFYPVDGDIKKMMYQYAIGIIIANSVSVVSTVCTYIFIASGRVKILLKLSILESSLNILLDLLFVGVFNMGVLGAGLGTAVSCTVRCVVSVILVQKTTKVFLSSFKTEPRINTGFSGCFRKKLCIFPLNFPL